VSSSHAGLLWALVVGEVELGQAHCAMNSSLPNSRGLLGTSRLLSAPLSVDFQQVVIFKSWGRGVFFS
jgi:hypothetical protein